MPKKKRSRKPAARPSRPAGGTPIARVVREFRDARRAAGEDPDDAWLIESVAELKRDLLASPDPTVWTVEHLPELLLRIVPRKVLLDAHDRRRLVPTVADYLDFLHTSGRWSPHSSPLPQLHAMLDELAEAVPGALADPARRSMGGNLAQFALSQGVDVTDRSQMAAFIDRFNAMDEDARRAVTDTGELPGPGAASGAGAGGAGPGVGRGAAFGLGPAGRPPLAVVPDLDEDFDEDVDDEDVVDDLDFSDIWPDFLGAPVDPETFAPASAEEVAADLARTVLVQRAHQLLAWIGGGRKVTSTGALRRADVLEVLELLDIPAGAPRSMWDVPELEILWVGLFHAGFLELRGGTARPAALLVPWAGADASAERQVDAGLVLLVAALTHFLGEEEDGYSPALTPLSFLALLKASQPGGVELDGGFDTRLLEFVRGDLLRLVDAGILTRDGETFHFPPSLLEVLAAVMQEIAENPHDTRGHRGR